MAGNVATCLRVSRRAGTGVVCALALGALMTASAVAASPSTKPTITQANDADHDGVYTSSETLPPSAKFPYTVSYQLTIFGGTANGPLGPFHTIKSITDDRSADTGSCAALVGTTINVNETKTCTYTATFTMPGPSPLVSTATMVWDGGGKDTASSSSTVDFGKSKGKCNSGNGNGSDPIQFTDPTAHCYGGDPGNSYKAGNRGGDEIPTSGGNPNPGGNNVP